MNAIEATQQVKNQNAIKIGLTATPAKGRDSVY
jgi:hypothetical protein